VAPAPGHCRSDWSADESCMDQTTVAVTVAGVMIVGAAPAAASAAPRATITTERATSTSDNGHPAKRECVPVRPVTEFYAAGRVASFPLTVPSSACSTISVYRILYNVDYIEPNIQVVRYKVWH